MAFISCSAALHLTYAPPLPPSVFDDGSHDVEQDPLTEHYQACLQFRDWSLTIDVKHNSDILISPLQGFARVTGDVVVADGKLIISADELEFTTYNDHLALYRVFDLRDPCIPAGTPARYPSYDHVYFVFQGEICAEDVIDAKFPLARVADVEVRQGTCTTKFRCYFNRLYRMFFCTLPFKLGATVVVSGTVWGSRSTGELCIDVHGVRFGCPHQPLPLHFTVERPVTPGPPAPVSGFAYVEGDLGVRAARVRIFASDIRFFSVEDYIKTRRVWDSRDPFIQAGSSAPPLPPGDAYVVFHGYVCTQTLHDPDYPAGYAVDVAIDNGFALLPIRYACVLYIAQR
ncbi:hypothetical protein AURDEDRAFT_160745 [Auricularia subglabra TFB-10046 SS5]|nr:hypothetical protein AURDEDRAFT_160745 [Auricularia subglabra TFB-10046 SS5]